MGHGSPDDLRVPGRRPLPAGPTVRTTTGGGPTRAHPGNPRRPLAARTNGQPERCRRRPPPAAGSLALASEPAPAARAAGSEPTAASTRQLEGGMIPSRPRNPPSRRRAAGIQTPPAPAAIARNGRPRDCDRGDVQVGDRGSQAQCCLGAPTRSPPVAKPTTSEAGGQAIAIVGQPVRAPCKEALHHGLVDQVEGEELACREAGSRVQAVNSFVRAPRIGVGRPALQ